MAFRISSFPAKSDNPYLGLFYGALERYGVERAEGFLLSPRWLLTQRKRVDAIHFHWPEWLWDGRREPSARALLKLQGVLIAAGAMGIKRVWTVHNLDPHERRPRQDRRGQRLLARHCDLLIVHSEVTAEQVREQLQPRAPVVVMPHGSYVGHYPEPRPRAVVLAELGLKDDRPVICCIGRLREYKGLELACEALARLGEEAHLVIAGTPHKAYDMEPLERYAETLPGLTLIPRALNDQEFADTLSVADAVLLPYREITGSGALLAAWSEGCGVIASDLDFFREMVPDGSDAGRLFQSGNSDALVRAVRAYLRIPTEQRKEAARAMAGRFSWERCVEPLGEVLRSWQRDRKERPSGHDVQPATRES